MVLELQTFLMFKINLRGVFPFCIMDNLSAKLIYNLENFFSPLLQFCRKKVINLGERVIRLIKIYLVWEKERLILLYLDLKKFRDKLKLN